MKKTIAALMTVLFLGSTGLVLAEDAAAGNTAAPAAAAPAKVKKAKKAKKMKKAKKAAAAPAASTTPAAK